MFFSTHVGWMTAAAVAVLGWDAYGMIYAARQAEHMGEGGVVLVLEGESAGVGEGVVSSCCSCTTGLSYRNAEQCTFICKAPGHTCKQYSIAEKALRWRMLIAENDKLIGNPPLLHSRAHLCRLLTERLRHSHLHHQQRALGLPDRRLP